MRKYCLSIIADNEDGVMIKILGLFASRGYNLESINANSISKNHKVSRITMIIESSEEHIDQLTNRINAIVPVHYVTNLSSEPSIYRELAFVKVVGDESVRTQILEIAESYRAFPVDVHENGAIFEIAGKPEKIDEFIEKVKELSTLEIARTGVAGMRRGPNTSGDVIEF